MQKAMAKNSSQYACQSCGTTYGKWAGKCDACGEWNTLVEETIASAPKSVAAARGKGLTFTPLNEINAAPLKRMPTAIGELDRVLGGGLVPGSAILIGGDPGIGKSTLLLQMAGAVANAGKTVAYISGEESVAQIQLRAERLGLTASNSLSTATAGAERSEGAEPPVRASREPQQPNLASATNVSDILASIDSPHAPSLVIIDSIQTMFLDTLDSAPGTVAQVRAASHSLIAAAKKRGICVILVGHVTKDGQIAGPRVVEHMVDTVLYFEGDRGHSYRILRAVKNRFGATDEIGVFHMQERGLMEVTNPSSLFLTAREHPIPGAVVFAGMEGTRPILVEVQALITPSAMSTPRRAVVGYDSSRLSMILAVLEARGGARFSDKEVFLSIAGGLRINEPAADLAAAAALLSALTDTPFPSSTVTFGEIGLTGEIRPVSRADARLKESQKLGFTASFAPAAKSKEMPRDSTTVNHVEDLVAFFLAKAPKRHAV